MVSRTPESRTITSFALEPLDPADWQAFEPGQYLPIRIPGADGQVPALRTYSISSRPSDTARYRITVKREAAPAPGLPDGVGSCFLHDRIGVGDLVEIAPPRGEFVLATDTKRPVILASGGVGLTPLVSMLHALTDEPEREVHFLHACDDGEVHALREEVDALIRSRPGLTARYCYRAPSAADAVAGRHHADGIMTRALLRSWLPLGDYDVYLCGPPPFMANVYAAFRELGVRKERIRYEFFGPATVLEAVDDDALGAPPAAVLPPADEPVAAAEANGAGAGLQISFAQSRRSAAWDEAVDTTLLAFAERLGLDPPFSCRAGICSTCRTGLIQGEVDYVEEPLDPPGPGEVLLCCARPRGPLVLDL
ncbi:MULTISPECIES: 2Fe-2S iron-sulfur cluster-binding protein [unclassified Bosea (in: a-proteobacteria)]|uniref:2Fe-2S iron-sulfur cluster-binding protein n=1 Tax=unclassified Bosea (in: a-proteobacteria) TaxID=2653178 RepID=UPI001F00638D|nr:MULTISPECIES: 2Fe-2S iron-sulfur cluster-binding protein [unclassified Bosea (in: a-proteobacteria)]